MQSRAGCSCAGPYGHRLLGIDAEGSERFRAVVRSGVHGLKPGWCRVGFHATMDDAEADFLIEAVAFVAEHGSRFLPLYRFAVESGAWVHVDTRLAPPDFGLAAALRPPDAPEQLSEAERRARYADALGEARALASRLAPARLGGRLHDDLVALQTFALAEA